MPIKHSIKFYHNNIPGTGDARILCSISFLGERIRLDTGLRVTVRYWDSVAQKCDRRTWHTKDRIPSATINASIDDWHDAVEDAFHHFEEADILPTRENMKVHLAASRISSHDKSIVDSRGTDESLFPAFDRFMADNMAMGNWTEGTRRKYATIRKHLFAISPTLSFDDLEKNGIQMILSHFMKTPDNDNMPGLSNTTVMRDVVLVKTFVKWSVQNGLCRESSLLQEKVKLLTPKKPVVFLTWDELMRVYGWDFRNEPHLALARDILCFSCFTSLRFSDVRNLKKTNITDDSIKITTQKTSDSIVIELNDYSREILKRYECFPGKQAIPVPQNQVVNRNLKEVGRICELNSPIVTTVFKGRRRIDREQPKWELLTTHCGRRTFVCNALMLGVSPEIVMKWTGHSTYAAMKPYIEIADSTKKDAMQLFNRK